MRFYLEDTDGVLKELGASREGLSTSEAQARLEKKR